ncbi:uncharacterized protein LTR77_007931 [Saxophila tyrrhenica]|uniref:F-box domain-containing protein n=1 Tax=Saxophila tyrrhenica TaxID=1690608 RepID=A0AAV9P6D2_9PEZI|nr:hypothetical protein LTR77_007931 [Saxophila tyrrhenica]
MTPITTLSYPERLTTFSDHWDDCLTTARQLAAIGHVSDRPPLESLEPGSRCISCSQFVRKELSTRAFGDNGTQDYMQHFRGFRFHTAHCERLQVRIPLEPQALLAGLYASQLGSLVSKFEEMASGKPAREASQRLPQTSSLFSLPTELRLEIYAQILPKLDEVTEVLPLNRDSSRVITRAGYEKTGPRDTTKHNILRTCRAINDEASDLLYSHSTFQFASSKTMYLFLRSIGKRGRQLVHLVDVHCGSREDAMAFALLASCEQLRVLTIRLPRPKILLPRSPLWCVDGMSGLLELSGLEAVKFGHCESAFGCMDDSKPDAEVIRRELTRPRGTSGSIRTINGCLDV